MSADTGSSRTTRSLIVTIVLWVLAAALALATFAYQDKTGPTYPLEGTIATAKGDVAYKFVRSETIGTDLAVLFLDPVPAGVTGTVKYRRYTADEPWTTVAMTPQKVTVSRRGSTETLAGIGALLPSLNERAGKYEYHVYVDDGSGKPYPVLADDPTIYARYKAPVPNWLLLIHILAIFASMTLALRTTFEAMRPNGEWGWMIWATLISLLLGAFVLGPAVQWYAFGVWWSGIPFGYDWTDNKVLFELVFWVLALILNWGGRRSRWPVFLAGVATLVVYFIPHSIFGSQYDYATGKGRGTTG